MKVAKSVCHLNLLPKQKELKTEHIDMALMLNIVSHKVPDL